MIFLNVDDEAYLADYGKDAPVPNLEEEQWQKGTGGLSLTMLKSCGMRTDVVTGPMSARGELRSGTT